MAEEAASNWDDFRTEGMVASCQLKFAEGRFLSVAVRSRALASFCCGRRVSMAIVLNLMPPKVGYYACDALRFFNPDSQGGVDAGES